MYILVRRFRYCPVPQALNHLWSGYAALHHALFRVIYKKYFGGIGGEGMYQWQDAISHHWKRHNVLQGHSLFGHRHSSLTYRNYRSSEMAVQSPCHVFRKGIGTIC